MYRDNTSVDMVSRAANQQQAQEVEANRARSRRLKSCLVERGYTEFSLTPEQRAHLATLPEGSTERREFLFKLGTDPNVLKSQSVKKAGRSTSSKATTRRRSQSSKDTLPCRRTNNSAESTLPRSGASSTTSTP